MKTQSHYCLQYLSVTWKDLRSEVYNLTGQSLWWSAIKVFEMVLELEVNIQ